MGGGTTQGRNTISRDDGFETRREFLQIGGVGAAAWVIGTAGCGIDETQVGDLPAPLAEPSLLASSAPVDLDLMLRARYAQVPILDGQMTAVARYEATVVSGDSNRVSSAIDSYLGPVIRTRKGERIRVRLINELDEPTILHWHGLHVPPAMDGHPSLAIDPGQEYVYEFDVLDRAGTYWYHPHPHQRTGPQVFQGLAGLFIVSDDEEAALDLPSGDLDLPLVIQDRTFSANNQLVYQTGGMMTGMGGFLGEEILVNGMVSFAQPVATRIYRLRLLNGSNSRVYKLAWSDSRAMVVIGTDGGLLERPVEREFVMLAPAERVELWADFSADSVGAEVTLRGLPHAGETTSMMGMGGMSAIPNGIAFDVATFSVEREEAETRVLPQRFAELKGYEVADAVNVNSPRTFVASGGMMQWLLNGRVFEMTRVASNEVVQLGSLEIWELVNSADAMAMVHPIHIHGLQFQVLDRSSESRFASAWESIRPGYVDDGWKDTVLLMPGERVRILLKFQDFSGTFLYHCHNLEHEDMGMMRNYVVE